jgi:hypothetical protein
MSAALATGMALRTHPHSLSPALTRLVLRLGLSASMSSSVIKDCTG